VLRKKHAFGTGPEPTPGRRLPGANPANIVFIFHYLTKISAGWLWQSGAARERSDDMEMA